MWKKVCSAFVLPIPATQERRPVSACLKAAPPPAPAPRPTEPRVAKFETCERDQLAPDLAPSRPKKPSASSNAAACPGPLRDLARCSAPRHEGGVVRSAASAGDERPENWAEVLEKVDSAPGIATDVGAAARPSPLRDATRCVAPRHEGGEVRSAASAGDERPKNRAEVLEKVDSAPGIATDVDAAACPSQLRDATRCVAPRHAGGEVWSAASAGDERPENRVEVLEKVDSAPGIATDVDAAACPSQLRDATRCVAPRHAGGEVWSAASAGDERPENRVEVLEKVDSAPGIATDVDAAACPSQLRDATRCVAPRHAGGEVRSAASAGDERPENRVEVLEKVDSAPGIATDVDAAACPSPLRDATRCVAPRHAGGEVRSAASAGDERPENWAEVLEKVDSAPGIATDVDAAARPSPLRDATRCVAPRHAGGEVRSAASAGDERPENRAEVLEKVDSAPGIATDVDAAACPSPLRHATRCVAPRQEGGEGAPAASAGDERPENRAEVLEKVESAPGIATDVDAAARPSPLRDALRRSSTGGRRGRARRFGRRRAPGKSGGSP